MIFLFYKNNTYCRKGKITCAYICTSYFSTVISLALYENISKRIKILLLYVLYAKEKRVQMTHPKQKIRKNKTTSTRTNVPICSDVKKKEKEQGVQREHLPKAFRNQQSKAQHTGAAVFLQNQLKPALPKGFPSGSGHTSLFHPLRIFLLLAPFFFGGFLEWVSCLYALFLMGFLLSCLWKDGKWSVHKNLTLLSMTVLVFFYGISGFWAVDQGMAIAGFCKFLPYVLFTLAAMQLKTQERKQLLETVPVSGGVMVILSLSLRQIPVFQDMIYGNGRLEGFFQYPNVFALFLLLGVILLMRKETWGGWQLGNLLALLAGIALTGSRTVFFLLAASVLIFCFILKGKRRWALGFLLVVLVAGTACYVTLTGNVAGIGRYLTASLKSSTLLGRFLYYKDALPVIWKHPFGLGYMGYFYLQGSFQTGVYSVLHVHNELLQILLDVGWIPAVLFGAAVVQGFWRQKDVFDRMVIGTIIVHCMLDFDLQFVCIGFFLLLALDLESGTVWVILKKRKNSTPGRLIPFLALALAGLCLWQGVALGLYRFGKNEAAVKVYPGCTGAWVSLLARQQDAEGMEGIADEILLRNQSIALAYSAKARAAYGKGDFAHMISYKQQALSLSKYQLEEYLDYFDMLETGILLYEANGDLESAAFCRQRLLEIPDIIEQVLAETDDLAWKILDQPELALPLEYQERLLLVTE